MNELLNHIETEQHLVKQCQAQLVLGWVTIWDYLVLLHLGEGNPNSKTWRGM